MIETADHNGIAILTLNHGPVNALDLELLTALPENFVAVADASAAVVTGSGRSFSAGVDLKRIVEGGLRYVEAFLPALSVRSLAAFEHPKPVVAAVNGQPWRRMRAAAACDIRLMSFGSSGLPSSPAVPFPTVPLEIMRHAVGPALDAMVLGAGRLAPVQPPVGLVHEIVEPDQLLAGGCDEGGLSAAPPDMYAAPSTSSASPPASALAPPSLRMIPRC